MGLILRKHKFQKRYGSIGNHNFIRQFNVDVTQYYQKFNYNNDEDNNGISLAAEIIVNN